MTYEEAIKIVERAKELGVQELHMQGLTVKFRDLIAALPPIPEKKEAGPVPDKTAEELIKPFPALDNVTAEELLYYATPYYDELQAKKEAQANKIAGEPQ
jgi:hypothetical protein